MARVEPTAPGIPVNPATPGYAASRDFVRDDLNTMGKRGHVVLRARDRVLEILQSENECAEWYRTKDADPAATFRTLTFSLDGKGDEFIQHSVQPDETQLLRGPYVAQVLQGEGPYSTVTINENGAFFQYLANVVKDRREGGPLLFQGMHRLNVGPYNGGTLRAQVLALLHEFGHVIDLLPQDADHDGAKSPQNTEEVLRYCRAEVESHGTPGTILASR